MRNDIQYLIAGVTVTFNPQSLPYCAPRSSIHHAAHQTGPKERMDFYLHAPYLFPFRITGLKLF